ncbi:hypothetical protein VXR13_18710, partial [Acinetobacter baumannii]|uniref:hypothetical protein n=1 Tax=Acinetobacter baumannii TaxID=470 RepID=UPI003A866C4A
APKLCLKFEWIGENSAFECLCNKAVDLTNMFRLNQKVKFKKSILINIKAIIKIQNKYSPLNQKNINKSPL